MQTPLPLTRDLVLIGGGHAHALVLRKWGMKPLPGTRVTVINPAPTAPYSGMLPGHIAGHYRREELDIDLVQLARFAGARVILGHATGIDPVGRQVTVEGRGPVSYDVASIDVGIHAEMPDIPGFAEHALGAKPLDSYAAGWRAFLDTVRSGQKAPEVAVIGAGVAGVELALAMAHALRALTPQAQVALIEAGPDLNGPGVSAGRRLKRALDGLGVTLRTQTRIERIGAGAVHLAGGEAIGASFIVGAAGAYPHAWLAAAPLPLTDGYVTVGADLRVDGFEDLFAVGDCAHMSHAPRPKAGVYAVRAASVLHDNLVAVLSGGRSRAFHPQRDFLKLISLGGKSALAEKWGRSLAGPLLWRWKNRIDQRFMEKFRSLPFMAPPPLPARAALDLAGEMTGAKPLCGGCGSKIGAGTLNRVLAGLPLPARRDVLSGPGDDAAVLELGGARQVITTDHLRAFTLDPELLARITAVHALGDIWAMGARPQAALASVTLPRLSPTLAARSLEEIMHAANDVLSAAGATIVGGHSTMGAEMSIGFTLTGLCDTDPISNAGARPGDKLILTRPIGTGTLLAAEMAGQADGRQVAAMLAVMAQPQAAAAGILQGAHAMTDVTGFGLAGHLWSICRASAVGAMLDLDAVPVYDGALKLARQGHRSSLYPANLEAAPVAGASGARGTLLHDPQTAGGLLAAVDATEAEALVEALTGNANTAAIIGEITGGPVAVRCIRGDVRKT